MYRGHTVGVVVPAYNEAGFVGGVIRAIPEYVDRIYVVDDASTDETWEEIIASSTADDARPPVRAERTNGGLELEREWTVDPIGRTGDSDDDPTLRDDDSDDDPAFPGDELAERAATVRRRGRVLAVRHRMNRGAGGAIKTGYLAALVDGVDVVATIDGDGQMDPADLSALLDPIVDGEAEYAKGNRLVRRGYREEIPRFRLVGNGILTFLTKIASGYWTIMDPQNGFTAISRQGLETIDVANMYEDYGYPADLLIKLNVGDARVADVSTAARYSDEESDIRYSPYIFNVSLLLLTGFLWRLKAKYLVLDFHPLAFFYLFGMVLAPLGVLGGLYTLWAPPRSGIALAVSGLLSVFLFVTGVICLLFGMVFDKRANRSLDRRRDSDTGRGSDATDTGRDSDATDTGRDSDATDTRTDD